jgi:predicted metal-dependent HD superfamily phosphohydrolase
MGVNREISGWYEQLQRFYSEPHRRYHNAQHIVECLTEFDSARHLARDPVAVELAIWFHDAIYDPRSADNEEQSAELAKQFITQTRNEKTLPDSIVRLVLATKQHDSSLDQDAPLMVDIDLSIFGQSPERFSKYETDIRAEYAWVAEDIFRTKRAEILERFLGREQIYNTEHFFGKYEEQSRTNLAVSVEKLRSG